MRMSSLRGKRVNRRGGSARAREKGGATLEPVKGGGRKGGVPRALALPLPPRALYSKDTSNMSPNRRPMARQDTASAWFWITNSWLKTGGLLFFFRSPIAAEVSESGKLQGPKLRVKYG